MAKALKDEFSTRFVSDLAKAIASNGSRFAAEGFVSRVLDDGWEQLELKERLSRIVTVLGEFLPNSYPEAIDLLIFSSDRFSGLPALVFPEFVGRFGLNNWSVSMKALRVFTPLCSSEFGIRPFIDRNPDRAFKQMRRWAGHRDEHVRRLASEGCRVLLPWAPRVPVLKERLGDIREILEILKSDKSLYVRRSVANNLNDISKLDTDLAIRIAKNWKGSSENTDWVVKHAMRGLLKKGVPDVLELFGYSNPRRLGDVDLNLSTNKAVIGGSLKFEVTVSTKRGNLGLTRVEYIVGYVKANGSLSEKVFLITDCEIGDQSRRFQKQISFKDLSTRKHYSGEHTIRIAVNGKRFPSKVFTLRS